MAGIIYLLKRYIGFLTLLLLLACSHKPPITVHDKLSVPADWQQRSELTQASLTTEQARLNNSYQLKHLPWLSQLIGAESANFVLTGVNQQQDLSNRLAAIQQAEFAIDIQDASFFPSLNASFGLAAKNDGVKQYDLGLSSGLPLDIWGKLSEQSRQSVIDWQSKVIAYRQQHFAQVVKLLKTLFSLQQNQQILALGQLRKKNLAKQLSSIELRYQAGLTNLLDVYNARTSLQAISSQVLQTEKRVKQLQRELPLLFGLPAHHPIHALLPTNGPQALPELLLEQPPELPQVLPAELLSQRADIHLAWLTILKQQAAVAIAYKERFPSFSLTANVNESSDDLGKLIALGDVSWQLKLNLFAPLFDAGKRKAKVEQARLEFIKAQNNYGRVTYHAFVEVHNALAQRLLTQQEIALNEQSYLNAEKSALLAKRQYQQGLINYRAMLANQRSLFSAKLNRLALHYRALNDYLDLLAALGGGWFSATENVDSPRQFLSTATQAQLRPNIK
ncbi:hypothetical protein C2869_09475 [Saccharobesus litoralis]|uniref:Efflux transporter, outer membrane factor (OMF) lipoprotein, NodT family n=1 Tax=Saccharobesus litoralis TaxID=2172099 RepID=A0A2S0VR04_9ALTE|nr:TolC family protein [Saccharobesus litoralis]AWB66647.1 hypothetical protein C2869_09475 [Saccharobesus litoralis]